MDLPNQVSELDLHANGDGAHYSETSAIIHQSEWGAQVVLHLHRMGSMINSRLTPVKNSTTAPFASTLKKMYANVSRLFRAR